LHAEHIASLVGVKADKDGQKHPPDNADIDYTLSCCRQHNHLTWDLMTPEG